MYYEIAWQDMIWGNVIWYNIINTIYCNIISYHMIWYYKVYFDVYVYLCIYKLVGRNSAHQWGKQTATTYKSWGPILQVASKHHEGKSVDMEKILVAPLLQVWSRRRLQLPCQARESSRPATVASMGEGSQKECAVLVVQPCKFWSLRVSNPGSHRFTIL